jgi:hypothetical protein
MNSGAGKTEETSQQRAQAQIAQQQVTDWKQRWQPVLTKFAADTTRDFQAGSDTRNRATTLAGTDNSVAYSDAADKSQLVTAATGGLGSAKQKLGIVGMGNDQATSTGLGSVAADQGVDDSYVQKLGAVTSLAKGQKADAVNAIGRTAAISAAQAKSDAQASLEARMGDAGLASKIIGTGAGLYSGAPKTPAGLAPSGGSGGVDMDQFQRLDLYGANP